MQKLREWAVTVNGGAGGQALRYFVVVLAGFIVDLSVAWSSHAMAGLDLMFAAALGFAVAMTASYFAHEFWTFRRPESAVSARRFAKFVGASGATLGARLLLIWLTGPLSELAFGALLRLLIAYGGSLAVGFIVNRAAVFGPEPAQK